MVIQANMDVGIYNGFWYASSRKEKKNDWSANNCKKCSTVLFLTQIHSTDLQIDKVM